jgi:purine-binding chemotaxis protein CheW
MSYPSESLQQFVVFRLNAREYALPISQTVEVLRMVALTPLPEAPTWLPGLINLRGRIIPVMELRARLGFRPRVPDLDTAILVAHADGHMLGLITDAVIEILTLPPASLAPPDLLSSAPQTVAGVARVDDRLIVILDLQTLCAGAEHTLRASYVLP